MSFLRKIYRRLFKVNDPIHSRISAASTATQTIAKSKLTTKQKFEQIYQKKLWALASPTASPSDSLSGHGSTEESTRKLRDELQKFFNEHEIRSLFDAPCGDFVWMQLVQFPPNFSYIGGDIVDEVVIELQNKYAYESDPSISRNPASRHFLSFDLTSNDFPTADVWLCKDCLQHLSNQDIMAVLENFSKSEVKWALISNHYGVQANKDIHTGDFRHVDLTKPPFNLPSSQAVLHGKPIDNEPKGLALWSREDIANAL